MNNKKKILILPRWYPNKTDIQLGIFIQRQAILMAEHFAISIIYAQALEQQTEKHKVVTSTQNGINEVIVYYQSASGVFRKLKNFRRYIKAQKIGLSHLNQIPDLTHVHVPYRSAIFALKLKRKHKTPFVITEHWSGHLNGTYLKKNKLDKYIYKTVLKKAKKISTVSPTLQEAFKKNTGFDTVVIPNYIEKSATTIPPKSENKIRILSVADLHDKTKNISGLLTAFKAAINQNPNLHLTLIGGGPDEQKIKELINTLHLTQAHLSFKGRLAHPEVLKEMENADFYICNSRYETFGMTVAEALYNGTPVICTPCGGPESFLSPTNSLMLSTANGNNTPELTEKILEMAHSYKQFDTAQISTEIGKQFGKKAIQQKWIRFYTS